MQTERIETIVNLGGGKQQRVGVEMPYPTTSDRWYAWLRMRDALLAATAGGTAHLGITLTPPPEVVKRRRRGT